MKEYNKNSSSRKERMKIRSIKLTQDYIRLILHKTVRSLIKQQNIITTPEIEELKRQQIFLNRLIKTQQDEQSL